MFVAVTLEFTEIAQWFQLVDLVVRDPELFQVVRDRLDSLRGLEQVAPEGKDLLNKRSTDKFDNYSARSGGRR